MNLSAVALSSTVISLSWQAPLGTMHEALVEYSIRVKLNNVTMETFNTSDTSYNVTRLEKFTNYTFVISVVNENGEGPSRSISEKTSADCKYCFRCVIE